jgi:hypothetical protein
MKKNATGRSSSAQEAPRAQNTNTGHGPEVRLDLVMLVWLLAPERVETLRRQLIDGKVAQVEPHLYTFAYSGPLEPEAERKRVRWMTPQAWEAEQAAHAAAEQTAHAAAEQPKADSWNTSNARGENIDSKSGYRIKWDKMVLDMRLRARALVENPEYQESLRRRLLDGKAPKMLALLLQWPEKKSRDPYEQELGKPQLTVVVDRTPGTYDPLAEREKAMLEAQKAEEALRARAGEETRTEQATAAAVVPDEPSDGETLELYEAP